MPWVATEIPPKNATTAFRLTKASSLMRTLLLVGLSPALAGADKGIEYV